MRRYSAHTAKRISLYSVYICLTALFFAEIACRLLAAYAGGGVRGLYAADPELGHRHVPDYRGSFAREGVFDVKVYTDGGGFRTGADEAPSVPADDAILLVGDSFVFGYGVEFEQTMGARLDAFMGGGASHQLRRERIRHPAGACAVETGSGRNEAVLSHPGVLCRQRHPGHADSEPEHCNLWAFAETVLGHASVGRVLRSGYAGGCLHVRRPSPRSSAADPARVGPLLLVLPGVKRFRPLTRWCAIRRRSRNTPSIPCEHTRRSSTGPWRNPWTLSRTWPA